MVFLKSSQPTCSMEQHCSQWAAKYMKYCLCSNNDWVSFVLGIVSVMTWFVAEIPQIITNCKKKSAEGLSLVFLLTWVAGDLMNLFGCLLEPTTLPTQYYMALLFTLTTFLITGQTIYYGYIYQRLKSRKHAHEVSQNVVVTRKDNYGLVKKEVDRMEGMGKRIKCFGAEVAASLPIPLPPALQDGSPEGELYFTSARSLSLSHTPPMGSFPMLKSSAPDIEAHPIRIPLLSEASSPQSVPPPTIKTMLCVVSSITFFLSALNLKNAQHSEQMLIFQHPSRGLVNQVGRKLLQASEFTMENNSSMGVNGIGTFLGWGMAFIYMGGRLPQICLNIRRGNVEGLNPLMFLFALVGNITYVGSILISSIAWSKIKPNLPWLVDAGGCVLLDSFILMQFIYFRCHGPRDVKKIASDT